MRRRKFLILVGSTTVTFTAWPLATVAQEPVTPTIGYLDQRAPSDAPALLNAFRQGLREKGYVDGRNVKIEYRWASSDYARLPDLVSELVARAVSVLVAVGGEPAALAAKAATSNIPIIFSVSGDPVAFGLVDSLSRPGTNATGVTQFGSEVVAKRL
jgi:putative tryptophan/tyrosine transport system substrate-binding protein